MTGSFCTRDINTPIGPMRAASVHDPDAGSRALCMLEFPHRRGYARSHADLERLFAATLRADNPAHPCPVLDMTEHQLDEYFAGARTTFDLPLSTPGTPFQQRVWAELQRIPCGSTISYGDLAQRVGSPGAQRAVGAANGRNRVAIIIPCHRVIESTGALRGYAGGLHNKQWLLNHERNTVGVPTATLFEQRVGLSV